MDDSSLWMLGMYAEMDIDAPMPKVVGMALPAGWRPVDIGGATMWAKDGDPVLHLEPESAVPPYKPDLNCITYVDGF